MWYEGAMFGFQLNGSSVDSCHVVVEYRNDVNLNPSWIGGMIITSNNGMVGNKAVDILIRGTMSSYVQLR